jgi:hypothetical protein
VPYRFDDIVSVRIIAVRPVVSEASGAQLNEKRNTAKRLRLKAHAAALPLHSAGGEIMTRTALKMEKKKNQRMKLAVVTSFDVHPGSILHIGHILPDES